MKKIIAFAGSNSSNSINQKLIEIVSKSISEAKVEIINLRDYPANVYNIDEEQEVGFPKTMVDLNAKMEEADGYIISTPEYNGSIPSVFKNTIDWLSRVSRSIYNGKPTVLLSASPGPRGGASVLNHLSSIMPYHGADMIGVVGIGDFYSKVSGDDLVAEEKNKIAELVEQLISKI